VTSGSNAAAAEFIDNLYASIVKAGTYRASSIKVAEAAKVIENTQRDVNIALVNELSLIFNRLGIDTHEVLEAAGPAVEMTVWGDGRGGSMATLCHFDSFCRFVTRHRFLSRCRSNHYLCHFDRREKSQNIGKRLRNPIFR
jgi:hypothetical protein